MKHPMKKIFSLLLVLAITLTLTVPAYAADDSTRAEAKASALKQLGLFKGVSASDNDFALNRAPTRTEALIMLIRVLGQESEALNGTWSHPFTDVASWADKYVGYAYEKGLTKGISATEFGSGNADSDMYLTFVLRALGYDDSKGDFAWNEPDALATTAGILPDGTDTRNFLRADVVLVSWAALEADLKGGSQTLAEKLITAGAFTSGQYSAARQALGVSAVQPANTYELKDGVAFVKSLAELKGALADSAVKEIECTEALEINEDITITKALLIVEKTVVNQGVLTVKANITLGGVNIENFGEVIISDGGFLGVYMTDFKNQAKVTVEKGGTMEVDRGGGFVNSGTLTNRGTITVTSNGGSLRNNDKGIIDNNGVIDCTGYYDNLGTYKGTGTEPVKK